MQQFAQPSVNNRWLKVWTQPRAVVRNIIATDPGHGTIVIMIAAGIVIGLRAGLPGVLISSLIAFPMLYLYAFLLSWVGSWFSGKGTSEELRAATVWGYYLPVVQWRAALIVAALPLSLISPDMGRYILLLLMV